MKFKKSFLVCRQDDDSPLRAILSTPLIPGKCGFTKGKICDLDKKPCKIVKYERMAKND
jgi:hypothetical protein